MGRVRCRVLEDYTLTNPCLSVLEKVLEKLFSIIENVANVDNTNYRQRGCELITSLGIYLLGKLFSIIENVENVDNTKILISHKRVGNYDLKGRVEVRGK